MDKDPFKEYIKQSEPNKRDKGYAWHTAIGLQAVDGLKTSKYLIDTAIKNIEGDISIDEAQELLNMYYEENPKADTEDRTEEADKVAVRIAKILSEKAFSFTPNEYILHIGIRYPKCQRALSDLDGRKSGTVAICSVKTFSIVFIYYTTIFEQNTGRAEEKEINHPNTSIPFSESMLHNLSAPYLLRICSVPNLYL